MFKKEVTEIIGIMKLPDILVAFFTDPDIGAVGKTLPFSSVSGKKLFFTFAKKILPLKGKNSGAITIVLEGKKKNAFVSFVMVRTPLALSQNLFL